MNDFKELIKQRNKLLKENKRLQAEFRRNFADFNKLLREVRTRFTKR
jgi:recombinational DNA repair ATPase RecF